MFALITWNSYGNSVCLAKVTKENEYFFKIEEEYFNCEKNFMEMKNEIDNIMGENYSYLSSKCHTSLMESYVTVISEEQKDALLAAYTKKQEEYQKIEAAIFAYKSKKVSIPVKQKFSVRYKVAIMINSISGTKINSKISCPHVHADYIEKNGTIIHEDTEWSVRYTFSGKVILQLLDKDTALDITHSQELIDYLYKKTSCGILYSHTSEYRTNFLEY